MSFLIASYLLISFGKKNTQKISVVVFCFGSSSEKPIMKHENEKKIATSKKNPRDIDIIIFSLNL
jgi:hypothetical protein